MLVGCALPLLLIFLLPVFGISGNVSVFIFVLVMFFCHLLIPMNHGGHRHQDKNSNNEGR